MYEHLMTVNFGSRESQCFSRRRRGNIEIQNIEIPKELLLKLFKQTKLLFLL